MKILKVKVKREANPRGGTHYVYPDGYDAMKIQVLAYESIGDEVSVFARGKYNYEYCIGVVKDGDAPQFLSSSDVVEITKDEAVSLGSKWIPQTDEITDQKKVLYHNSPERGVGKGISFAEMLEREL